jgi:hypothetical protein
MPFDIDTFKSQELLKKGVLRTNRYEVFIPPVQGLKVKILPNYTLVNNRAQFVCDSTNFPMTGVEIHGVKRYGYGPVERKPIFPIFSNLMLTFITDQNALVHKFFLEWLKIVVNYDFGGVNGTIRSETNVTGRTTSTGTTGPIRMGVYEVGYKKEYAVDMNLKIYTDTGEIARDVNFRSAFPIIVPDLRLGWGQLNEFVKVPVLFSFVDWHDNQLPPLTPAEANPL